MPGAPGEPSQAARYGAESVTGAASMTARQPFASLPLELVFHVDTFLDARGVRHLSSTCRALRALHSSAVWRKLYMARWGAPSVRDRLDGHARRRSPSLTDDDTALLHAANRAHPVASAFNFFWCTIEGAFTGQALRGRRDAASRHLHLLAAGLPASLAEAVLGRCLCPAAPLAAGDVDGKALCAKGVDAAAAGEDVARTAQVVATGTGWPMAPSLGTSRRRARAVRRAATTPSPWKVACAMREGGADVLRCRLCRRLDARTPEMVVGEALATRAGCAEWVSACSCTGSVHRRCLERKIDGQLTGDARRSWRSMEQPVSLADERAIRGSLGRCDVCHDEYRVTRRLPESAKELVSAAVQQWDAVRLTAHSVMYVGGPCAALCDRHGGLRFMCCCWPCAGGGFCLLRWRPSSRRCLSASAALTTTAACLVQQVERRRPPF